MRNSVIKNFDFHPSGCVIFFLFSTHLLLNNDMVKLAVNIRSFTSAFSS